MATNYRNFSDGIGIVPKTSTTNNTPGDIEILTDGKVHVYGTASNDAVVMEALAATLTNKTLTAPVIATIVNTGTLTLPTTTDTLVGRATTDTLTNKSISGATNTLSNIANASLTNSSVTINGSTVALGASTTVTANTTNALTIGTGLSGTSFNGSAPVTITIDGTVVTLTGSQTLTNKTLTSPVINTATADTVTGIAGTALTLRSASGQNLVLNSQGASSLLLQVAGTTVGTVSSTGLAMATGNTISLAANSQVVSLQANAAASATYTITLPAAAPTSGTALVYNGTSYVWSTVSGGFTVTNSTALTAGGTVSISTTTALQLFRVASSSGAVTLSTTPFGTSAPTDGTVIRLVGTSDTNTIQITNTDSAKGCLVKGTPVLHKGDVIEFQYLSTDDRYFEISRNF